MPDYARDVNNLVFFLWGNSIINVLICIRIARIHGRLDMSFFLYKFIDSNENIIYIGRTNDIRRRILKEHFRIIRICLVSVI